jgi:hypothetical protein
MQNVASRQYRESVVGRTRLNGDTVCIEHLVVLGTFLGIRNPDPYMLGNHTVASSARRQQLVSCHSMEIMGVAWYECFPSERRRLNVRRCTNVGDAVEIHSFFTSDTNVPVPWS